jgi:adenylate cyclase
VVEIERKFLVEDLPELGDFVAEPIAQGYIAITEDGTEVRLRRKDGAHLLTIKHGTGLQRLEEEIEIDQGRFEVLWPLTEGARVRKTRHSFDQGGRTIEVDTYDGELKGLVVAEIEFDSKLEAEAFEPLPWMGPEVTDDPAYKAQNLATHGIPSR